MEEQVKEKILKDKNLMAELISKFLSGNYPKVYFIRSGDYIKIGFCNSNVARRICDLQIGNPIKLELEQFIRASRQTEQNLHKKLDLKYKKKESRYVRGEWYRLNPLEVEELIKEHYESTT